MLSIKQSLWKGLDVLKLEVEVSTWTDYYFEDKEVKDFVLIIEEQNIANYGDRTVWEEIAGWIVDGCDCVFVFIRV